MTDKSKCCNAPVTITGGMPEDDDRGKTSYFVCTKCDEPCDIVQPDSEDLRWCPIHQKNDYCVKKMAQMLRKLIETN